MTDQAEYRNAAGSSRPQAAANARVRRGPFETVFAPRGDRSKTATVVVLFSEDEDFRQRERVGMRDGQERSGAPKRSESIRRAAVKPQLRGTAAPDDLDVAPQHAKRMTGAERLHGRFLRRETSGEMNGRNAAAQAVRHFAFGEHTMEKPIAVAFDRLGDAIDIGDVEAEPDDGRHATP